MSGLESHGWSIICYISQYIGSVQRWGKCLVCFRLEWSSHRFPRSEVRYISTLSTVSSTVRLTSVVDDAPKISDYLRQLDSAAQSPRILIYTSYREEGSIFSIVGSANRYTNTKLTKGYVTLPKKNSGSTELKMGGGHVWKPIFRLLQLDSTPAFATKVSGSRP